MPVCMSVIFWTTLLRQLELWLQRAWQDNARWLTLLRPLSWLYGMVSAHKKRAYLSGKKAVYRPPVPLLVIGNITVGGSGKTPLIIALVCHLKRRQGIRVGVISRGYGGTSAVPRLVVAGSDPKQMGDEPCLIANKTGAPVAIARRRQDAIDLLLAHHKVQLIISDDGLQHYAMARDAEWIVVDSARGFGNGYLLPAGFLREPISRLDGAVVIYHEPHPSSTPLSMYLTPQAPQSLDGVARPLPIGQVYALTAIGYPPRFFASLQRLGFSVTAKAYPDHHYFSLADISHLTDQPIIVTEKDAVKLAYLQKSHPDAPIFANIWVLPVTMQLSAGVYRLLAQFIKDHV